MKTRKHLIVMAIIAIFAIAITTCDNGNNNPPVTAPATINLDGIDIPFDSTGFEAQAAKDLAAVIEAAFADFGANGELVGKIAKVKVINGATMFVVLAGQYELHINIGANKAQITTLLGDVVADIDLSKIPNTINLGGSKTLEVDAGINSTSALAARTVIEGAYNGFANKTELGAITKVVLTTGNGVSLAGGILTVGTGATAEQITTQFTQAAACVCEGKLLVGTETCDCDKVCGCTAIPGQRVDGVAVTNPNDVANFEQMVTRVTTALTNIRTGSETRMDYVRNNIKEIRVVTGLGGAVPFPVNGVLTVETGNTAGEIRNSIRDWLDGLGIAQIRQPFNFGKMLENLNLKYELAMG